MALVDHFEGSFIATADAFHEVLVGAQGEQAL
jgi:hypothetical protein